MISLLPYDLCKYIPGRVCVCVCVFVSACYGGNTSQQNTDMVIQECDLLKDYML